MTVAPAPNDANQREPGLEDEAGKEGDDHAYGEINLASIRAVYKEEVKNSQALDSVLCPTPEFARLQQSGGEGRELVKTELGCGLDAFVIDNVFSNKECSSIIEVVESMGFSFWNPAR
jgi:hypothetical protein